jgi:hypothetical protein
VEMKRLKLQAAAAWDDSITVQSFKFREKKP